MTSLCLLLLATSLNLRAKEGSEAFVGGIAEGFTLPHYDEHGIKLWEIRGTQARISGEDDVLFTKPKVVFFLEYQGSVIDADRAIYKTSEKVLYLSGNVVGVSAQGLHFSSQEVRYHEVEKKIIFPISFIMQSPNLELQAQEGVYTLESASLQCKGSSDMVYTP